MGEKDGHTHPARTRSRCGDGTTAVEVLLLLLLDYNYCCCVLNVDGVVAADRQLTDSPTTLGYVHFSYKNYS